MSEAGHSPASRRICYIGAMRGGALALLALLALVVPGRAEAAAWGFRTPGDGAYCRTESTRSVLAERCMSPSTGFWIRLISPNQGGGPVRVQKGVDIRFLAHRDHRVPLLPFGREFASSDALVFTCRSRRDGLACKHYDGLAFWLGRAGAYRIYYDKPGFRPHVRPLFRAHGVWCGIDLDVLEPAAPVLECWRPADGAVLVVDFGGRYPGSYARREQAIGFEPAGFPLLGPDESTAWRCRRVGAFAEGCSTHAGKAVFTCRNASVRLTCRNRGGHGFWVSRAAFYAF